MSALVYVAGPMTGLPDFNRPAFDAAQRDLEAAGHRVLNPARQPLGLTWAEYMRRGLRDVLDVDAVVVLPGWEISRGARLEVEVAERLGAPVAQLDVVLRWGLPGVLVDDGGPL